VTDADTDLLSLGAGTPGWLPPARADG